MKKQLLTLFAMTMLGAVAMAQAEGTPYYLPKTEMRFQILIEKTSYSPGEYAIYSERFLKKSPRTEASTEYSIIGINMYMTAIPDSAKAFFIPIDKKHTVLNVQRDRNGVLMAINTTGHPISVPDAFKPAPKAKAVNPHDFMIEEILTAGSTAKMAELTAREIYDIRSSRSELSRGEAEYMPKDGEQLSIMLENLNRQEQILLQTFEGVTVKDTIQQEIRFVPEKEGEAKQILFRLSKKLGLVDADDLAGSPYYIVIDDLNIIPEIKIDANVKRGKEEPSIAVNMPGKVKATILEGNNPIKAFECYVAQYGRLEYLSSNLFGRKILTTVRLNPVNGNVELIDTEPLD